jgi:hypothetical protein
MPVEAPPAPAAAQVAATPLLTPTPEPHAQPTIVVQQPAMSADFIPVPRSFIEEKTRTESALSALQRQLEEQRLAAQTEQAKILAQKGEVENALKLLDVERQTQIQREQAERATVETAAKNYALSGELSRALAAHDLVPDGTTQLTELWKNQFIAERQGDSFVVRTPTFQSVQDFVKAKLAEPSYAHFKKASTPGGAGAPGAQATTPTPSPTPTAANTILTDQTGAQFANPTAMNLGQAAILGAVEAMKKATPSGVPAMEMGTSFGLGKQYTPARR